MLAVLHHGLPVVPGKVLCTARRTGFVTVATGPIGPGWDGSPDWRSWQGEQPPQTQKVRQLPRDQALPSYYAFEIEAGNTWHPGAGRKDWVTNGYPDFTGRDLLAVGLAISPKEQSSSLLHWIGHNGWRIEGGSFCRYSFAPLDQLRKNGEGRMSVWMLAVNVLRHQGAGDTNIIGSCDDCPTICKDS